MVKFSKATSVEDYRLINSFENIRKTLSQEKFIDRLDKPLAYWALPNDRRLPLAFLGRTIRELLETPFDELFATPGIGQKKISSFVKLLSRATSDQPPAVPFGVDESTGQASGKTSGEKRSTESEGEKTGFDPSCVSEVLWVQWQDTVRRFGLGKVKLGRVAPTLRSLPTVIWNTPLETYLNYTVSEIRELRTHGEKRVRVVLEAYFIVHDMLGAGEPQPHLSIRFLPKFVRPVERWLSDVLERTDLPSVEELRVKLIRPIVDQIKNDSGETIYNLVEGRLGLRGTAESVRQQSKQLGVTRARVYQLLEDCHKVMGVRWGEGCHLFTAVYNKFQTQNAPTELMRLFVTTYDLFYPGRVGVVDVEDDVEDMEA